MRHRNMKVKERPKYSMISNVIYMIDLAWRVRKPVLLSVILVILIQTVRNIVELFLAPTILGKIEYSFALPELVFTILGFIGLLTLLQASDTYLKESSVYDKINVRMNVSRILDLKLYRTSYPNAEDEAYISRWTRADRCVRGSNAATEAIWDTLSTIVQSIAAMFVYVSLLTYLHPALMLLVVITSIIGFFASKRISEWRYRHRKEEGDCQRPMQYVSLKAVNRQTAKDIRIFNMQPWLETIYHSGLRVYEAFLERCGAKTIWAAILDTFLAFIRNGAAYAVLLGMTISENLTASEFLLYFSAVGGFSTMVTNIVSSMLLLHEHSMDISAARELIEAEEQFQLDKGVSLIPDPSTPYELAMQNVTFRYPGSNRNVLTNINLTIHPGEKLAIVGLNGAGKTTLVKLLCGLYDPTEGQILLNGTDIRTFNRRDYYRLFSAVFQQFSLLQTTIRENVIQDIFAGDEDRMWACIEQAGLTDKIKSYANGVDTHVGHAIYTDGIEFSGGETQRLMLARALYKNGPILLLDEPTAALDPIAENDIYMKYNHMTQGRTAIFISHRLASTRFCDRILFIGEGQIQEEGTHENLLQRNREYAKLFSVQAQYYREEGQQHV